MGAENGGRHVNNYFDSCCAGAATMNCWMWAQKRGHMNEYVTDC